MSLSFSQACCRTSARPDREQAGSQQIVSPQRSFSVSENLMNSHICRRRFLQSTATVVAGSGILSAAAHPPQRESSPRTKPATPTDLFPISLNSSTLRGHKLPITRLIDIAAKTGYQGIEPWPNEIASFVEEGGSLKELRRRLGDANLKVTGAIAFFRWMVDDSEERTKGLEQAKRFLSQLAELGATHVAAPPTGDVERVSLLDAAERYHDLLEVAAPTGVIPAVEVWGFAKNCNRLGQAALIAMEADHPNACILPDVYHLLKGGSALSAVRYLNGKMIGGFHFNDVPAGIPRDKLRDADRVYPGDGEAPLAELLRDLRQIGYRGPLSIELFNPEYYKQDPERVARTAIDKTRAVMERALSTKSP